VISRILYQPYLEQIEVLSSKEQIIGMKMLRQLISLGVVEKTCALLSHLMPVMILDSKRCGY
jgi:hypothetical protein